MSGHRAHWLKCSIYDAQQLGIEVVVYTSDSTQCDWIKTSSILAKVSLILNEDCKELLRHWCKDLKSEDIIGVCFEADKILPKLLFVKGTMRLLIMRPYLEEKHFLSLIRFSVKQLLVISLSLKKSVKVSRLSIPYSKRRSRNYRWVRDEYNTELFQDKSDEITTPKEMLGIPRESKVVTLGGFMDSRKNPMLAYEIVEELRKMRGERLYFILAGVQSDDFKAEIISLEHAVDVIQIDRFLSDDEFKGLLRASHLVLLPYKNRGASGLVLNSLVLGTPVFLKGSQNWKGLQNSLSGRLIVSGRNLSKHLNQINALLDLPKISALSVLLKEQRPKISDFVFRDLI